MQQKADLASMWNHSEIWVAFQFQKIKIRKVSDYTEQVQVNI